MKRISFQLSIVVGLLLAMATVGFAAPVQPTFSTLAAAYGATDTTLTITSTTGMTVSTQAGVTSYLLIDHELMRLRTVPAAGTVTVTRAQAATNAAPHASGVYVIFGTVTGASWDPNATGSPTYGVFLARGVQPTGSCTLSVQQFSPVFGTVDLAGNPDGQIYSCNGGKWTSGPWPSNMNNPTVAAVRQCVIPIGSLALTSYGTDTVDVAGTIYVASIDLPTTRVVSTLSGLTGTTAPTTDKQLFSLYDQGGFLIASSALAGLEAATADIFFDQAIALVYGNTGTKIILPPGRYFVGNQLAGTTTSMQKIAIATGYQSLVGNSRTGAFGTLANITAPTALTDVAAPIMCVS